MSEREFSLWHDASAYAGYTRQPPMNSPDRRAKPAVYFGGKASHYRFRALQC